MRGSNSDFALSQTVDRNLFRQTSIHCRKMIMIGNEMHEVAYKSSRSLDGELCRHILSWHVLYIE